MSTDTYANSIPSVFDYINSEVASETSVLHNISFVTDINGHHIIPTDYIIITFTNYYDITLPTTSSGWTSGIPIYSINGNRVLITNVELLPSE